MDGIPESTSGRTAREVAREVALKAGEILIDRFRRVSRVSRVSFKGRGNIVTDVDTEVEGEVLAVLRREFPNMGTLGEESAGSKADVGYVWIVDPLDGTRNYASGIPFFSTVVAWPETASPWWESTTTPYRTRCLRPRRARARF